MSYHIYSFEKLEVYQEALDFSIKIRAVVKRFPKDERFELISQLRRAVDSISSNIAEGSGRATNLDQANFTNMSYSSALECIKHLTLAHRLEYIAKDEYIQFRLKMDSMINKLNALYRFQLNNDRTLKRKVKK
jgi:four helix bundle protein